jgi:hypothetical protein
MRLPKGSVSVVQSGTVLFLITAILLFGLSVALGQVWSKKDYKEWAAKDCEKILTDSPWAKSQSYYGTGLGSAGEGGQAYTKFIIQFLSALPVRHATIRSQQIAAKYDKLPPEEKQKFDQQAAAYLAADYSQKIVVKVNYETNVSSAMIDMDRSWGTKTIANFQNSAFLIGSKGVKVAADGYSVKTGYFILTFPRQKDGKPLLTTEDKSLILQFEYTAIQSMGDGKGQFEFKVKDMIYSGEIAY